MVGEYTSNAVQGQEFYKL